MTTWTRADYDEAVEERAAILEVLGGVPRAGAEREARRLVGAEHRENEK